jgi:phage shock protein PspC (stress-responsive transcriptional regulator)
MKKTLTINLSGSVFHIDDDAYEKLYAYLTRINRHFGNDEDAKEIVEDIEARIAEIFAEKIKNGGEVINIEHVEEVIVVMGTPEAISNEEEVKEKVTEKKTFRVKGKRLYRDPDDRVLGGVCSGLGAYFNMDPVIIRIIFVAAFFLPIGSSALIYLILWIVVPKASSTAQRLEMKGEEVNIDNISKTIKEEIQDVKENFRNYRSNPAYAKGKNGMNEVIHVLGSILAAFAKVILVIFGVVFLMIGAIALIALIGALFASHEILSMTPFEHGFNYVDLFFIHGSMLTWVWVGIGLVIGIPLLMLTYAGIKMIFKIKPQHHAVGSVLGGLFVIGIIILAVTGSKTLGELRKNAEITSQINLTTPSDTLYITANQGPMNKTDGTTTDHETVIDNEFQFDRMRIATKDGKDFLVGFPQLRIEKVDAGPFTMEVVKQSRGRNFSGAQQNAKELECDPIIKDSLVNFQSSFVVPSIWRNQKVDINLRIPVGKTVYFDKNVRPIIYDIDTTSDLSYDDMVGKYWTMKPEGLTLVNRAIPNNKPVKK